MLGQKDRNQPELFVAGSLRALLPDDHILVRVDRVLDLSWLRAEVSDCYSSDKGRPGIDPEAAVRLMLAGFLLGIVHDRRLMREAQVNLAIRWFIGYALHEALPDHFSLTRIRQRWGVERFRQIFERTVRACIAARIATGEVLHVDASLIRADVSWDSLAVRHVEAVGRENGDINTDELVKKESRQTGRFKKVCVTDPDASMATNGRNRRLEPAYKQHAAVDDLRGVIVDVEVTTGETNEGQVVIERIDAGVGTLLQKRAKAHHLVGHRWVLGSVERVPTKPYRRSAMTTAVDQQPAAARFVVIAAAGYLPTAPTPLGGTRPGLDLDHVRKAAPAPARA
jgi:transposase